MLSFHSAAMFAIELEMACTSSSGRPCSRRVFTNAGRWRRPAISPTSSSPEQTPRTQPTRSRLTLSNRGPERVAEHLVGDHISERSWQVSVLVRSLGGTPYFIGSKSTGSRNAPRLQ